MEASFYSLFIVALLARLNFKFPCICCEKLCKGKDGYWITIDAFHLTKNSGVNFQKFPGANGTEFSRVENNKLHSFVRLEFFNDFEFKMANID